MNNKQVAVIVRPYLEQMQLSAQDLKDAYATLRVGEYMTKYCLRCKVDFATLWSVS